MAELNFGLMKSGMNRLIIGIFSCIIILASFFIANIYLRHISYAKEKVLQQLYIVTQTLANDIDPEHISYLIQHYPEKNDLRMIDQDSIYHSIYKQLKFAEKVNRLQSPIYLLAYNQKAQNFEFISSSSNNMYFRHVYDDYPTYLKENYEKGGEIGDYETRKGRWISSFYPIKSESGATLAVIHADYEYSVFVSKARNELINNILVSVGVIVFISFLLYTTVKNYLTRQEKVRRLLISKNNAITKGNEQIKAQHEEITSQNEVISRSHKELEMSKKAIEEKNKLLNDTNQLLDEKVKKRTRALQVAIDHLDDFLYRSYHDILGPIATLKGLCELSKIEVIDNLAMAYISKIDNSVNNLEQSIRNVNAVYEIKNRHIHAEDIYLFKLIHAIISRQAYLFQIQNPPIIVDIPVDFKVNSDGYFLDLLFSDIIRYILKVVGNNPIDRIIFSYKVVDEYHVSILITDLGNNNIFSDAYFQDFSNVAMDVNHQQYIFHNSLKKLKSVTNNHQEAGNSAIMEIVMPRML